jgi:hypothetical protein
MVRPLTRVEREMVRWLTRVKGNGKVAYLLKEYFCCSLRALHLGHFQELAAAVKYFQCLLQVTSSTNV